MEKKCFLCNKQAEHKHHVIPKRFVIPYDDMLDSFTIL